LAGRPPAAVFDPQIAAGLVGLGYPLSHTNLVRKALGVQVPPGEAFTDWRARPLKPRQLTYAAADVQHLLALRAHLGREAERRGRTEWVESECRELVDRVIAGEHEERWLRGSGASSLNRRALGVLREVWRWRESAARTADVPPRRVMNDDVMVEVAKRGPRTTEDLFALRGLERSSVRRAGADVVAAVRRGLDLPDAELPAVRRRDDPPQVGVLSQLAAVVANGLAAEHEVDPALLATSSDLHDLVRWHLGLGDGERPEVLHGWRGAILGEPLVALLEGRSSVRVSNSRAANPLRVEPVR
jgi:ribonuclease D